MIWVFSQIIENLNLTSFPGIPMKQVKLPGKPVLKTRPEIERRFSSMTDMCTNIYPAWNGWGGFNVLTFRE